MRAVAGSVAAIAAALVFASPAASQTSCDPFTTPAFQGTAPTAASVLGFNLGSREVTTAQSDKYLLAVDAASDRVISGVAATSAKGRALRYAIVGRSDRMTSTALAGVRANIAKLMNPSTTATTADSLAASTPAILWIAGNVHGNEESGTDAALRVLYELADRTDCAAQRILDNAIVVILPIQNPDGREADTRQNSYGFDMNRDWFARTQPETDGKLELLRQNPPVMFIDAHEMSAKGFFFPPNADPVFHEISEPAMSWINGIYGPSLQALFKARSLPYFNYSTYDLFYSGYGDTVPANGFGAAGMTFEKYSGDTVSKRTSEQYLTQWNSLSQAAINKQKILREWYGAWVDAKSQGTAGALEPNAVYKPGTTVKKTVPAIKVRHYFIRADEPDKASEVQALVRRLQRMDVVVRKLSAPLTVPDYHPYGRPARSETLPAGTYWITMAQRQKHWIQALMNESTYTPVGYAYDIVGWSNPLLFNVSGGYSGATLSPSYTTAPAQADPGPPALPATRPVVAVYSMSPLFITGTESGGWLKFLLDRWGVAYKSLTAADIAAGKLAGVDVLLVPDGIATSPPDVPIPSGYSDLGTQGRANLKAWVSGGGRFIGWRGGGVLASAVGISGTVFRDGGDAGVSTPGSLFRVKVDQASPLAAGVGAFAWVLDDETYVLTAGAGAGVPLSYPTYGTEDFFVSGQADGASALSGRPAVTDERYGSGRVVSFAFDPNFRGFTDGTEKVLRNGIFGANPATAGIASSRAASRRRAMRATRRLTVALAPLRLVIKPRAARKARRIVRRFGATYHVQRTRRRVQFVIDNPRGREGDDHPYARRLELALRRAELPVVMFRAP